MTLQESIERLRTRLQVDLESEVDLDDNVQATEEIVRAAKEVSRETYSLWDSYVAIHLIADVAEVNLLNVASSSTVPYLDRSMHHIYGVHVNGSWLNFQDPSEFFTNYNTSYYNEASNAHPGVWTWAGSDVIRLSAPPNATAVAASDNFTLGFAEHDVYDYANYKDVELQGPSATHLMIVDKAAINVSLSYVSTAQGLQRRGQIEKAYAERASFYKAQNLARQRPLKRKAGAGTQRRVFGIGRQW